MFESLSVDDASARSRATAIPPLVAVLVTLVYLTLYPLARRVPPLLFWSVAAILFAGVTLGAGGVARLLFRERVRGRALGWLAGALVIELLCAWLFLGLTLPWL